MKHAQPFVLALVFGALCALLLGGRAVQARSLEPGAALDRASRTALDPLGDPLTLTVTVGVGPGPCATTQAITVPAGTQVNYCYTLVNHTSYTLTRHTLHDTHLESIFADYPYTLSPGALVTATRLQVVTGSLTNLATWQATQPITGYASSTIACLNYPDADGGQNLNLADDQEVNLTLPFAFDFYDRHSPRLRVSNNGVLLFDEPNRAVPFTNENLPSPNIPHGLAAFWDDWDDETGAVYAGSVSIPVSNFAGAAALAGVEPQGSAEFFAVEYRDRSIFTGPSNPGSMAVLLAAPGQGADGLIIVCYKDTDFDRPGHDFGASATLGLNHNGSSALLSSFNTAHPELTGTLGIQYAPLGTHHGYAASGTARVNVITTLELPLISK